jgi:anti-sigma factor RsiW
VECDEVVRNLEAYEAGELPESERAGIVEHLAECPECEREREAMLALAAELRSAGDSFRALHPFTIEAAPAPVRRRRAWPMAVGAAAAVWMILLTTAAIWPSFAERLTFLPVGQRLSQASPVPSPSGGAPTGSGLSLSDAPRAALAAVDALFEPPEGRLPSRDAVSAQLSTLLPDDLIRGASSVRIVSIGPVRSVSEDELRLIATVDIAYGEAQGSQKSQRDRLLLTVTRPPEGSWRVSHLQVLGD